MKLDISPQDAWQPLPSKDWNEDAARHLLRRAGWAAQPAEVSRLMKDGLSASLDRLFPATATSFSKPRLVENIEKDAPDYAKKIRSAESLEQRRLIQREQRERQQQAIQDLSIKWLQFASLPENAVAEKWVLFLSDVYVVSQEKVQNTASIYSYQDTLRQGAFGKAPDLAKAVSRTPAMIRYLDLQDSKTGTPNENFARELFELFLLGEGNYTEQDIKESARAFTGYREHQGMFRLVKDQHDESPKTIFGKTGNFSGDDVIDLAFTQPAAGRFLPHEMVKFYLSDDNLPIEYLAMIGDWWSTTGYDMRKLAQRFFGSRLFFDPAFRGTYIKSPIQFYLGLVQDLNLNVAPIQRHAMNALRLMGENPFRPPNVRGWVGGRLWINSGTLSSRRQLVETLFTPINEDTLNADEQLQLVAARSAGLSNFTVTDERLDAMLASMTPEQITARFVDYFLPIKVDSFFRSNVLAFLSDPAAKDRLARLRSTAITLLQSPEYQLC
ncbi:MAG TPA: DUF1800 domain-containing protein [Rariglobus sp.]|jgi:uncharacterized protein (DUF1800 family)|nr:DUF1800 domain-containing protein [Rariglobus sp.]